MDEQNQNNQADDGSVPDPVTPTNPNSNEAQGPQFSQIGSAAGTPASMDAYAPPAVPTNSLAIMSLVSSLLGWSILPVVGAIAGIITGILARNEIKSGNGRQGGDGLAIAGIIISALHLVFACLVAACIGVAVIAFIADGASNGFAP